MQRACTAKRMMKTIGCLMLLTGLIGTGTTVSASTVGGFSIRAVIPENQVDTKQTYFDLRMKPGDEQDVQVVVTNSKQEEMTAEVRLNAASTGRNGLIVYTNPDSRDEIMKLSVTDVATPLAQRVTVPALGSETVTIRLKMPDEAFDGVILGGIAVTGEEDGEVARTAQGVSLRNNITYVTALKLTADDKEAEPDFELASVTPELVNYRTAVVAALRNKAARIVKGMDVEAEVYNKGSDTVLRRLSLTDAEMAPLSKGSFVIDWENEALRPGIYRLKMTADYGGRIWEWDEEFMIAGEAEELNREAVGITKNYAWLYWTLGVAVLALVFAIAFLLGRRKRDRDDQQP